MNPYLHNPEARRKSGMSRRKDRIGLRLGRLVITARGSSDFSWRWVCECGAEGESAWENLRLSKRSCGCLWKEQPNRPVKLGPAKPYLNSYGYWQVYQDGKYERLRRLVMEWKLGRKLLPGENVHHINGDRSDNRPDNLELWITQQPSGQRVEDQVAWARAILKAYGDLYPEG